MLKKMFKTLNAKKLDILSPIEGDAIPVSQVNDPAFQNELLGKGVAIRPLHGRVVAPFEGTVTQVFDTGHAIRMVSCDNIEILIHIGLETINLKGRNFSVCVREGDKIKPGDVLMLFDYDKITAEGFDIVSPVVVCNSGDYQLVEPLLGAVEELEPIIRLHKGE